MLKPTVKNIYPCKFFIFFEEINENLNKFLKWNWKWNHRTVSSEKGNYKDTKLNTMIKPSWKQWMH